MDAQPPPAGLTLRAPLVVGVGALTAGAVALAPLVRAVLEGRPGHPVLQVLVGLTGAGLVWLGADCLVTRARLDATGAAVRGWRGTARLPWDAVKGVSLVSDGGVPHLKVVGHDRVLQVRAWALRARHDDGELEPAAAALPAFGAAHGVRIRVRTIASPRPGAAPGG